MCGYLFSITYFILENTLEIIKIFFLYLIRSQIPNIQKSQIDKFLAKTARSLNFLRLMSDDLAILEYLLVCQFYNEILQC